MCLENGQDWFISFWKVIAITWKTDKTGEFTISKEFLTVFSKNWTCYFSKTFSKGNVQFCYLIRPEVGYSNFETKVKTSMLRSS